MHKAERLSDKLSSRPRSQASRVTVKFGCLMFIAILPHNVVLFRFP